MTCDWPDCDKNRAGAMRFCAEHGHELLLRDEPVTDTGTAEYWRQRYESVIASVQEADRRVEVGPTYEDAVEAIQRLVGTVGAPDVEEGLRMALGAVTDLVRVDPLPGGNEDFDAIEGTEEPRREMGW